MIPHYKFMEGNLPMVMDQAAPIYVGVKAYLKEHSKLCTMYFINK